ncbi:MAG: hypothetical protein CYPHOPRED_001140 [Cyphobasidiales sp. Tagirdzhanova-0007]|nr:MAG: hypothetical protein CYPHOPRED_001140 [Cyphobasidiales sp. Tagirdzhanova-0007]
MTSNSVQRLAWIGLGNMGRAMVTNLAQKAQLSSPIMLYNRTKRPSVDDLVEKLGTKVQVASSIAAVVDGSDIIFTSVVGDADLREVIGKILERQSLAGKLFVDTSTVAPTTIDELAELIESANGDFVSAPVFGAPTVAQAGSLIFALAGKQGPVARTSPLAKLMGKTIIDLSGQPQGRASLLKLVANSFTSDYYKKDPIQPLGNLVSSASNILQLAEENKVRMRTVETISMHLEMVQKHMGEKGDAASCYGAVRVEAGLPFEN